MEDHFMLLLQEQNQRELLRKTNDYAEQFGLHLGDCDIQELLNRRRESLALQNRVEFGKGILEKMLMYGKEANNQKQEIERQHHTIPNQRNQRLKGKALWKCA